MEGFIMDKTVHNTGEPDKQKLIEALCCDNEFERIEARKTIAAKGRVMIDVLKKLLSHPKHQYRWEAMKTLDEMGDPDSIPIFLKVLEDDRGDLRWIAAEGLIKLGRKSVEPLLKNLLDKTHSVLFLSGAHHVFYSLRENKELPDDFPTDKLLSFLKCAEAEKSIKPLVYEILGSIEKQK
jgi:HEAT repeat protein